MIAISSERDGSLSRDPAFDPGNSLHTYYYFIMKSFKKDGIFLSLSVTQACARFYSLLMFCVAINFVKFHLSSLSVMKISYQNLGEFEGHLNHGLFNPKLQP